MIVRILVTGVAVWVAALLVPGVEITGTDTTDQILTVLVVALIFGVVNAVLGSILKVLTLPFTILTLGLFALVVNALLFWITAAVAGALNQPFEVQGFLAALLGALVVSIVRMGLSRFTSER